MAQDRIRNTDGVLFDGPVAAAELRSAGATITGAMIAPDAGIEPTQMAHVQHVFTVPINYSLTADAAVGEVVFHIPAGNGEIVSIDIFAVTAGTGTTSKAEVELYKNGVTMLSANIDQLPADAAYELSPGTLSVSAYVAGDRLSVAIVTSAAGDGAKPKGQHARIVVNEVPVP